MSSGAVEVLAMPLIGWKRVEVWSNIATGVYAG
jgi:hypothetical protein